MRCGRGCPGCVSGKSLEKHAVHFTNFSELLEGYSKLMDAAANELESTDQSLKTTMNNFG